MDTRKTMSRLRYLFSGRASKSINLLFNPMELIEVIITCLVECVNASLHFTVLFSLSAPLLTLENVLKAVEGVKDLGKLTQWFFGGPLYSDYSLKNVVELFLQGQGRYQQPSWRAVIFALDGAGETHLANHIRSYGEPVQGVCVCVCSCLCAHASVHV